MSILRPILRPLLQPLTRSPLGASIGGFVAIAATGGTVTESGGYRIHTFTSSGDFIVTNKGTASSVEYLVVAGGGAGGGSSNNASGGGGAGGLLTGSATIAAQTYAITVGAGGVGDGDDGPDGGNSVIAGVATATGGGGGGAAAATAAPAWSSSGIASRHRRAYTAAKRAGNAARPRGRPPSRCASRAFAYWTVRGVLDRVRGNTPLTL